MSLKVLELFSGIGGAHFAFSESQLDFSVVGAVDINTSANEVYKLNFESTPILQKNIEALGENDLQALSANLWWMSPPCQPFTRNGLKKDCMDRRTQPLLHILDLLKKISPKPLYIMIENVKGFEQSDARTALIQTLSGCGFTFQEFLLNPLQLGIPNSRERYYLLAKLKPLEFHFETSDKFHHSIPKMDSLATPKTGIACESSFGVVNDYLETSSSSSFEEFLLSNHTLSRFGLLLDIVRPGDNRSCCFTKAYGHYVEGTGSVLQTNDVPWEIVGDDEDKQLKILQSLQLRYFTPREVANLMGFPPSFKFPNHFTVKQCYRLLGNSLSVHVVSRLISLLIAGD